MNKVSINKIIILIFLLTLSASCFNGFCYPTFASSKPLYAQIKNSNTYLFKSAEQNTTTNKWCLIEKSYFVKIINNYNNEFYKVEYNGITGFIKKSEIMLINETPKNPYPTNASFSTNSTNCYLRTSPQIKTITNNTICAIPANTKNLKFIGKIFGEEAMDFKGSVWYLTEYNGQLGYIYSAYTNSISVISENLEIVTPFSGDDFSKINPLTNFNCLILIILTLIPCLILIFMLYYPKKSLKVKAKPNFKQTTNNFTNYYDENL